MLLRAMTTLLVAAIVCATGAAAAAPNIVFVLADDMEAALLDEVP